MKDADTVAFGVKMFLIGRLIQARLHRHSEHCDGILAPRDGQPSNDFAERHVNWRNIAITLIGRIVTELPDFAIDLTGKICTKWTPPQLTGLPQVIGRQCDRR